MTQTDWEKGTLSSNATASEASPDWERGAISGPPQAPGLLRSAGDSAVALGSGITQGVKMLTDVAGADNAASRALGKATDALTDLSSPYAKAKKQERAEKIKAAEDSGSTWEEVKAYAGSFADAPLDTTLNALGTSAAPIVAGTLSGVAAIPVAAVRAAQIGLAAAQGVGGIKGQIHESVKQKHLEAGATEADASKRADAAQAYAGPNAGSIALGGVLGAAAGGTGAESVVRRLAGQRLAAEAAEKVAPGVLRSAVAGAAKEAPMEMLQGGQERHASNTALQGEGFDVPTWQGVAGQAALEGLASAPMGGGFGAVEGMAHKGATRRHGEGAAAFASGEPRTPPDSIKSVVAKAQWVRGWDEAAANVLKTAEDATGAAVAAGAQQPEAQAWTTSEGAAPAEASETATAVASPANAPNLDYETLPGAAPEAQGNEIDFTRDFPAPEWGTELGAAGQQPAATAAPELTPSQAMGLDPNAGALSKAAAMAVDSGASPVVQPQVAPMAEQQAASQVPAGVDPDTGEVSLQAQMDELKSRIAFMNQQGAAQGWDGNRAAQRNALQTQLTRLELQAAGEQGRGASTTGAPAPVQLTGINQILAKQIPDMNEQELQQAIAHYGPTHKRTKKLEKALQALAQKPLTAIESGANGNVFEAYQAQQGSAQPAQTGTAQAGQDAGQGVGNGTTPAANSGAQEQGASLAKAQAQVSEAAGAPQAAVGKAAQIAREGNAEREAQRQRQLDASERWTRMTTVERQAVAATAPGLTVIARKNVHTRAWPDLGEKIREKLLDSLVAPLVESTSKAPSAIENAAKPAPNAVSGDALPKPAAQPVGDEKQFSAETGTLGIPRAEMPQVPTANHGGLVKHLNAQGIAHETTTVDAAQLKPTQAEYSPTKVEAAKTATGDRAVIVSSDGHIIDGHHQAVAAAEEGKQVRAIVLDAPVEKALAAVKASPSANTDAVAAPLPEPVTVPKSVPQRMKEAKAAKEAASAVAPKPKSVPEKMREAAAARADKPAFRREAADAAMGADFDVASFLQIMNEGQPAPSGSAAAAAPSMNVRPSYSPAARAEAVRAVKGTADAIRKAWANGPEVIVAFDMQDAVVPESARRADLKQRSGGARGAPEGFYYQGKVYLMASKLKTPNDAARVLFHEALGHHGLRGLFGKDLGLILNQVATMRKADVDAKIAEYGLRRVNRLDRRTAAEEVLAEMAQNTPQIGFVRRAVAAIRTWLRTNVPGFKSLALTDAELIRNFILPARAWVERGVSDGGHAADATFSREAAPEMRAAANFMQARQAVKEFQGKPLTNAVTGMQAVVSRKTLDKMLSSKAVSKSDSATAHATAVANVDHLFEQAIWGWSKPDRNADTNFEAIHRFFAPMAYGDKQLLVKLTVKEVKLSGQSNPLYTVEAVELNESKRGKQWVEQAMQDDGLDPQKRNPLQREWADEIAGEADPNSTLAQPRGVNPGRSAEDVHSLAQAVERSNTDESMFSRSRFADLKDSALDQLTKTFAHEGKVSLWDKSVGTMRHLAERAPSFKPVYESAQQNIDDVSMLANDAADMAPRILPRVESLGDLKKKPVSAADNKAVARPLFEGTLIWARDENGKPTLVDDLQKRYANLSAHNKAAMLLKQGKIKSEVLAMWPGLPVAQFEKLINSRFENKMLKAGIVWSDAELQAQFGADANQISLYREARAAIDRSIDMTARTDMLRVVGEKYEPMRDAVLAQPSVEAAAQLLLDTLEQDAKADPDSRDAGQDGRQGRTPDFACTKRAPGQDATRARVQGRDHHHGHHECRGVQAVCRRDARDSGAVWRDAGPESRGQ
ncbi:hypothetical protein [Comamonas thiooxydans]|uniref:LPD3 domain-containing protein n=1 Tax=Comamonas thiooxydans TaxID=363952 RepID=UPI002113F861|nr:hypothetical protein [Comamonas thiooxydans]UUE95361.1 hypothetical protein MJ608_06900 [Comamonas thiooxydans]